MKLNVADPSSGGQKQIEIDDEKKLHMFFEKRMGQEVDCSDLGDEWKGYVLKVTGGCDKQGFPMMQGVLAASRVSLLLKRGQVGFQAWRGRPGERRRKSIRGCIVGPDISMLNLIVVKKGANDLPGITDQNVPRRLGPKRASKIRKLFNLTKYDDVTKFVVRREVTKGSNTKSKAPKIQRLVTPAKIARWKKERVAKRARSAASKAAYEEYRHENTLRRKNSRKAAKERKLQVKISKGLYKPPKYEKPSTDNKKAAPAPTKGKIAAAPAKVEKKTAPAKVEKKTAPAKVEKKTAPAPTKKTAKKK